MERATFDAMIVGLLKFGPLSADVRTALRDITRARSFAQDEWLLRGGEQARFSFWIARGLVREYYIGEEGSEHIRRFLGEGELTGSLLDLLSGVPAVTFVQALEPTQALVTDYARFDALCTKFPDLQLVARRQVERLYLCKAQREHAMLALSARERLAQWLSEQPALDARVSRRYLASYLGITPEHLSRLRRAS